MIELPKTFLKNRSTREILTTFLTTLVVKFRRLMTGMMKVCKKGPSHQNRVRLLITQIHSLVKIIFLLDQRTLDKNSMHSNIQKKLKDQV